VATIVLILFLTKWNKTLEGEVGREKWEIKLFYSLTTDGVNKAGLGSLRDK